MKILSLLTVLIVVASTVGSLHSDDRRSLVSYTEYQGACRKNSDGSGKGSDGKDYDLYKRENNPDVDFHWCKDKCNDKSKCTGFEFRDTGDTSHCEVWTSPINGYEKKNAHECHVKEDGGGCDHYFQWNDGVCRKHSDGSGTGNNGDEYDLYKDKDYVWCHDKCSDDPNCTGFEYIFGPGDKEQCEIWHVEIKSVKSKPDAYCDIKKCH